jgi:hypothetical protein
LLDGYFKINNKKNNKDSRMSKLTVLKCNICNRQIEVDVEKTRIDKLNCIITNHCAGKLLKIGEKNTRTTIYPSPITGVEDWIPRGVEMNPRHEVINASFSLLSGKNHIAVAVDESRNKVFDLTFKNNFNEYGNVIEYYFVRGTRTTGISGADDSSSKSNFTCNPYSIVKIYINGELIPSNAYRVFSNKIQFVSPLMNEKNVLNIAIFNTLAESTTTLHFKPATLFGKSAWDNIIKVGVNDKKYDVLICDDLSNLTINKSYVIDSNQPDPTDAFFLLSSFPNSSYDRLLTTNAGINNMLLNGSLFDFRSYSSSIDFTVSERNIVDVFPQVKIIERQRSAPDFLIEQVFTDSGLPVPSENKNKNIIGPI